jgi:hypothetical protein
LLPLSSIDLNDASKPARLEPRTLDRLDGFLRGEITIRAGMNLVPSIELISAFNVKSPDAAGGRNVVCDGWSVRGRRIAGGSRFPTPPNHSAPPPHAVNSIVQGA